MRTDAEWVSKSHVGTCNTSERGSSTPRSASIIATLPGVMRIWPRRGWIRIIAAGFQDKCKDYWFVHLYQPIRGNSTICLPRPLIPGIWEWLLCIAYCILYMDCMGYYSLSRPSCQLSRVAWIWAQGFTSPEHVDNLQMRSNNSPSCILIYSAYWTGHQVPCCDRLCTQNSIQDPFLFTLFSSSR